MINLDKHRVDIRCPKCNFQNKVTLKQVRIGKVIICRGCKSNLWLRDHRHSVQKATRTIRRSLNALFEKFSKIGNLNMKF